MVVMVVAVVVAVVAVAVVVVAVVELIQFFLIVNNANAEHDHQQQNNLKQDGYSIAGGFKRAAGELHVIHVGGLVHLDHLDQLDYG